MGSLTLPFRRAPQGQHHYLFCDATWNLWKAGATDMAHFHPRLVESAERLERQAYEQAAHVFPIAEYVREDLINHYGLAPEKVTAVGTGLGLVKPFHGEKDGTRKRILFTAKGRFFDKGGPLAVQAFRLAREQDPELELTLVGCEDGLQLPPTQGMTTLGFVPFEELQRLFETHHLFLLPATNEPWGLVYLEAMACGMPIVGLNRNSFPELSGGGRFGWAPPAETPEALAQTLLHAFADRARLYQMGRRARTRCLREYTWGGTVRTMIDVIDSQ
ncbi:MAG: glycosyltransferase family 4 protein [Rhodothermales bacterium]|nr:glycosyltransferase family 4 protein [Rhodothermales bacterium]